MYMYFHNFFYYLLTIPIFNMYIITNNIFIKYNIIIYCWVCNNRTVRQYTVYSFHVEHEYIIILNIYHSPTR